MRSKNSTQKRIVHRLKIARGHLDKVISMAEGKEYCMDIILQSHAVEGALKEVDNLILENHLATHAADQMRSGKSGKTIKEILSIYKLSRKRN